MSRRPPSLEKEAPWRSAESKPIPKIHQSPILRVPLNEETDHACYIMKHPDPIGSGLASCAVLESAGPDCIVPGLIAPVRVLGLKVWPIEMDFKYLEPVARELENLSKIMDSAVNLMNRSLS